MMGQTQTEELKRQLEAAAADFSQEKGSELYTAFAQAMRVTRDPAYSLEIARMITDSEICRKGIWPDAAQADADNEDAMMVCGMLRALAWQQEKAAIAGRRITVEKPCSMDRRVKMTVIIPVYNTGAYVADCIRSILNQTLKDIRVICINDGSSDDSLAHMLEAAASDDRTMVIDQAHGGVSSARNLGLTYVNSDYVYYMDSDDLLDPEALQAVCDRMQADALDVLYFDGETFYENVDMQDHNSQYDTYYLRQHDYPGVYRGIDLFKAMEGNKEFRVSVVMQAARADYLKAGSFGFMEGVLHEDNLYAFQVIAGADRAGYIHKAYYKRRVRQESIMTRRVSFEHCCGYFMTYLQLQKEIEGLKAAAPDIVDAALCDFAYRIFSNVMNEYDSLPAADRYTFYGLETECYYQFRQLVFMPSENHRNLKLIHDKLQQTYAEKSEINAKLQLTYKEKADRGIQIKELKAELDQVKKKRRKLKDENEQLKSQCEQLKEENASQKKQIEALNKELEEKSKRGLFHGFRK